MSRGRPKGSKKCADGFYRTPEDKEAWEAEQRGARFPFFYSSRGSSKILSPKRSTGKPMEPVDDGRTIFDAALGMFRLHMGGPQSTSSSQHGAGITSVQSASRGTP